MAGHSHSANIAHRKGLVDAKRGKLFTKLCRAIYVAARTGRRRPLGQHEAALRDRQGALVQLPKDNIERSIKKATGELGAENFEEVVYEGYGPGGVAVLCEALTDNRNRTAGELRRAFEAAGGNLGASGCVSYLFNFKGLFVVDPKHVDEDRLMEVALEAGADDVQLVEGYFEVTCDPKIFEAVRKALEDARDPDRERRDQLHPHHLGRPRPRRAARRCSSSGTCSRRTTTSRTSTPTTTSPRRRWPEPQWAVSVGPSVRSPQAIGVDPGRPADLDSTADSRWSGSSSNGLRTKDDATMPFVKSERLRKLPPYLFAEIDKKKKAAIAAGRDVINLGVGDPDRPTPTPIIRASSTTSRTRRSTSTRSTRARPSSGVRSRPSARRGTASTSIPRPRSCR